MLHEHENRFRSVHPPRAKYITSKSHMFAPAYLKAYATNGAVVLACFGDSERGEQKHEVAQILLDREVVQLRIDKLWRRIPLSYPAYANDGAHMIPDFQGADDIRSILDRLIPAARKIMLEHCLAFGQQEWSITALELYLWTGNSWCDPCIDRKPGQAKFGTWYVNRGRNPNHGRIDIAAGNGRGLFAGLLIRELDHKDGSAIALQKIIRGHFDKRNDYDRWTSEELEKIASIDGSGVTTGPLKLKSKKPDSSDVWVGPRIFYTKDPNKKNYLRYPLRVAAWETKKLKTLMRKWDGSLESLGGG